MQVQKKSTFRVHKMVAGFVLMTFSMPCVLSMIYDFIVVADNLEGALIVGTFAMGIAAAGGYLLYLGFSAPGKYELVVTAEVEREVLRMAHSQGGRLAPTRLTMNSNLSLDEAELVLEELQTRGYARLSVTDDGTLEYTFPSLVDDDSPDSLEFAIEKAAADHERESAQVVEEAGENDSW